MGKAHLVGLNLTETPHDLLYEMVAMRSSEAKKIWFEKIRDLWEDKCAYCGKPPIDTTSLTKDHVKPRTNGGETRLKNVIPACRNCNLSKGSSEWKGWYSRQDFYSVEREHRIKHWLKFGELP